MKRGRIANQAAAGWVAVVTDDDVYTAHKEEHMVTQAAEEVAWIDRLIEEAERELATQHRAEQVRLSRDFTDQVRARRAHRRADREVLRALPPRLDPSDSEPEAA